MCYNKITYRRLHPTLCLSEQIISTAVRRGNSIRKLPAKSMRIFIFQWTKNCLIDLSIFTYPVNRWRTCDSNGTNTMERIDWQQLNWILWVRVMVSTYVCMCACVRIKMWMDWFISIEFSIRTLGLARSHRIPSLLWHQFSTYTI